jgi:hypothetical protein
MRRQGTALIMATVGTAAFAAPAQAQSVAIASPKPCYLPGEQFTASGAGFTAGGAVDVQLDGTSLGQIAADAAGNIATPPIVLGTMRGAKSHSLTLVDQTNTALMATTSFLGTTNQVIVKPKDARAGTKRRLKGYGFMAGPRVFMHVRGNGYRADKRIAKPSGPCGTFVTRKVIVPGSAGLGAYKVQFDAKKKYSKKTRPRVVGTMRVSLRATGAAITAQRLLQGFWRQEDAAFLARSPRA